MSQPDTGPEQLARLEQAGLRVTMLPQLTDVDTVREAERVAAVTPGIALRGLHGPHARTRRSGHRRRPVTGIVTPFRPVGTTPVAVSG